LFLTETETLTEKDVKTIQDYKYITIATDPKIVDIQDIHEIIPIGKFQNLLIIYYHLMHLL